MQSIFGSTGPKANGLEPSKRVTLASGVRISPFRFGPRESPRLGIKDADDNVGALEMTENAAAYGPHHSSANRHDFPGRSRLDRTRLAPRRSLPAERVRRRPRRAPASVRLISVARLCSSSVNALSKMRARSALRAGRSPGAACPASHISASSRTRSCQRIVARSSASWSADGATSRAARSGAASSSSSAAYIQIWCSSPRNVSSSGSVASHGTADSDSSLGRDCTARIPSTNSLTASGGHPHGQPARAPHSCGTSASAAFRATSRRSGSEAFSASLRCSARRCAIHRASRFGPLRSSPSSATICSPSFERSLHGAESSVWVE
jgi:hypothetical protein